MNEFRKVSMREDGEWVETFLNLAHVLTFAWISEDEDFGPHTVAAIAMPGGTFPVRLKEHPSRILGKETQWD